MIPSQDEMFFRGVLPGYPDRPGAAFYRYIESSIRTFGIYKQIAEFMGGFQALSRVFDFGSGYGRLTRALVHRIDPRRIWVCDIYANAVSWQAEEFGVNALVSVTDPDRFALDLEYDIIFVSSVFSHLPDSLFRRWLRRLYDLVAPDGVIAFSVHDESYSPAGQKLGSGGIGYSPQSESETLGSNIYGMSYVTSDYVTDVVSKSCGSSAVHNMKRFSRALFENQDLYIVGKNNKNVSNLQIVVTPIGGFSGHIQRGFWSGWGLDPNPNAQIVMATLYVGDEVMAQMVPTPDNSEVMRYFPGAPNIAVRWTFETVDVPGDAMLRVELKSSTGAVGHCYAEPARRDGQPLVRS